MNFIKHLAESGVSSVDEYQDKRSVLLTNYVSLILLAVVAALFVIRKASGANIRHPELFIMGALVFLLPIILNRMRQTNMSKLMLCIAPTIFLWYVFISSMLAMKTISPSVYDGLRVYLLASSCIPYLVLTRRKPVSFTIAILPSLISIVLFEDIFNAFGVGYSPEPHSDAALQQVRFVMSYAVISGGCYMLQSVILRNDDINKELILSLEQKTAQIKCQNDELLRKKDELAKINRQLEQLADERSKKLSAQRDRILQYAYANAHYVRGPVARLLGLVELYKIDPGLDCDWLLKTVDRETRDIDTTIRRISAELQPLD